jgi:superfamily I DNA and/or RNA helicase
VVEINTVDAFQGKECDVIIFSCTRAPRTGRIGFLQAGPPPGPPPSPVHAHR